MASGLPQAGGSFGVEKVKFRLLENECNFEEIGEEMRLRRSEPGPRSLSRSYCARKGNWIDSGCSSSVAC